MKGLQRFPMAFSLLLSLLLIICISLTVVYIREAPKAFSGHSLEIPLDAFAIVKGSGKRQPTALIVNGYTGGKAIISNFQGLKNSGQYRYIRFQLTPGKLIDELPLFFWRSSDTGKLHSMALEENLLDHIDMKQAEGWGGAISEYGFIFSESKGRSWRMQAFSFTPDTLMQALLNTLSDWLEFEVWSQHSVNFIYGGAADTPLSMVVLVGAWVLLTLLLYSLIMRSNKQPLNRRKVAGLLLSGWMLLDARWILNLYQQVQLTRDTFAGKSPAEKYEAGLDARYYRFFQHIKEKVLPPTPQFVYILDNKADYYRAKAPWFLAPHNVFNVDSYPRPEYAKKGGFVLILHPVPGLKYDPHTHSLRWGKNGILPVSPAYLDPLGTLYKILPPVN
ncbi:hypothetical protein [Thiolapillus sp.]